MRLLLITVVMIPAMSGIAECSDPTPRDTLRVQGTNGVDEETVRVNVTLANHAPVAGILFSLAADRGRVRWGSIRATDRTNGMDLYSRAVDDTLRIVMIDPGRTAAVLPGSGSILEVDAQARGPSGRIEISVSNAQISDDGHPPRSRTVTSVPGYINVLANRIWLVEAGGSTEIHLLNEQPVVAAQFDLVYDPGLVRISDSRAVARGESMAVYDADISAGRTRVILADLGQGSSIGSGDGVIAEVTVSACRSHISGPVAIGMEGAVLSGPAGKSFPVRAEGGEVHPSPRHRPAVVIDEVLASPPDGLAGDANGDGSPGPF